MKLSRLLLSALPLLPFSLPAEDSPDAKVVRLGEFVVEESSAERDVVKHPGLASPALEIATSSVERLQIELQSGAALSDALEFAPGIFTETRGRKEKSFSSFRGQIYPYPDYALNGIWQREFQDFSSVFPAAAIERIEILRSSGALTIGPNSGLVGAINLIPRRFDEQTTVFDARNGTHNTALSSNVTGDSSANGYYTMGANWWSTSGPDNENATERMLSFFATGGLQLPDGLRLEAMAFYARGERELRRAQDPAAVNLKRQVQQFSPNTYWGGTLRAILEHSDEASTELTLGYFRREPVFEQLEPTALVVDEFDWEYTAGLVHARRLGEDNTLRLGVQWNQWVAPEGKRSYTGSPMDVHTFSGFVIDEQRLGDLTIDAGLRYTRSYQNEYTQRTFAITGESLKALPIENEWDDPVLTATFGAKYALNQTTELYGHLAAGTVSAPPGATSVAGTSLSRETRIMLDAGVKFERPDWGMLKIGGFLVERQDAIVLDPNSKYKVNGVDYYCHANQDVRQYGLEIEARSARIMEYFELFAAATLMESRRNDGGWSDYREIPDQIVTFGVYSEFGPIDVNLFGKFVGGYENYRFAATVNKVPQYHDLGDFLDLNLTAGYSFGMERRTRFYVSLENLLDDEYSTVNSYPDYGFLASVGMRHIF
ncbi:MAG: TonB-dependent receptor [Lentisphaeria bacterium]|jgi:outer membrane cobalamin receptor|nr:TonB-dependent receptor [Lentisphaeria bacterium]